MESNAKPAEGYRHTPLRAACLTGNTELIRLLIDKGSDVNAQSEADDSHLGAVRCRTAATGNAAAATADDEVVKGLVGHERGARAVARLRHHHQRRRRRPGPGRRSEREPVNHSGCLFLHRRPPTEEPRCGARRAGGARGCHAAALGRDCWLGRLSMT